MTNWATSSTRPWRHARRVITGGVWKPWHMRCAPGPCVNLFGSTVPGYKAPAERTTGPGTRVVRALIRIVNDTYHDGETAAPAAAGKDNWKAALSGVPALHEDFQALRDDLDNGLPDDLLARGS